MQLFSQEEISGRTIEETYPWMKEKKFVCVQKIDDLKTIVDDAIKAGLCVLDLETSGLDTRVYDGKCNTFIAGYALSYDGVTGYYVPVNHGYEDEGKFGRTDSINVDYDQAKEHIQRLLLNCVTVFHNCLYDHEVLHANGFVIPEVKTPEVVHAAQVDNGKKLQIKELMFHDTFCLAYLLDVSLKSKGLKSLSENMLNMKMLELDDLFENTKDIKFYTLDPINDPRCVIYAASDAICTYLLYQKLKHVADEQAFIYYVERRCTFAIRQMERNKCLVDIEKIKQFKSILIGIKAEVENEATKIVGYSANLASPSQVGKILTSPPFNLDIYEKDSKGEYVLDHKNQKKIETGEEALKPFIDQCPLIDMILTMRDITKTVGTYLDNFLSRADRNNEVKFKFVPWRVETGRFAAPGGEEYEGYSGVNIQALTKPLKKKDKFDKEGNPIPIEELVRKKGSGFFLRSCIKARPGYKMVAIDYSGQELRVAANVSQEKIWVKEFLEGNGDLHTESAKLIFKTPTPDATMRDMSKTINFQTLYGGGPQAISRKIKISFDEAKQFQERMIGGLVDLKRWIEATKKKAHKNTYAITPLGRRRPLPMIKSEIFKERAEGERLAVNTPIQGAGGDIMKMAMVRANEYIGKHGDDIHMLITVHDELVFEIKEDKLEQHIPELMNLMSMDVILQHSLKWPVPLSMDCEIGDNWDVEYEYFQKNPHLLSRLNDSLRKVKALAMNYDPVTLKPKAVTTQPEKTQVSPKAEPVKKSTEPKEPEVPPEAQVQPKPAEVTPVVDVQPEKPAVQEQEIVEPAKQAEVAELAARAVESLSEPEKADEPRKPFPAALPEEHEILEIGRFDEFALKKAHDAFSEYKAMDSDKAFLIAISVYLRNIWEREPQTGKELQSEIRKILCMEPYKYILKNELSQERMYQIECLVKMCPGTNPYKIVSRNTVIAEGNNLYAAKFDFLAEFLNL